MQAVPGSQSCTWLRSLSFEPPSLGFTSRMGYAAVAQHMRTESATKPEVKTTSENGAFPPCISHCKTFAFGLAGVLAPEDQVSEARALV